MGLFEGSPAGADILEGKSPFKSCGIKKQESLVRDFGANLVIIDLIGNF